MKEKIKILLPIEIPLLGEYANMSFIRQKLEVYKENLLNKINISDLEDWKILILITFRSTNGIGVFKRVRRYPSEKEFEISISVCIPNQEEINYGYDKVKEGFYIPLNEKKFHLLKPNYEDLETYMLKSSILAMDLGFNCGFTCNGKKIKFKINN